MHIGIIGNGFVGGATGLLAKNSDGENNELVSVSIYDTDPTKCEPAYTKIEDLVGCDFVFVCVPTPMDKDGSCYLEIVESVVRDLRGAGVPSDNIFIRSTVPVGTSKSLGVNFMPEFLTEANWKDDFINTKHWIVGFNNPTRENADKFDDLLKAAKLGGSIKRTMSHFCSTDEAELVKYTRNCFLATKVAFFNEIHDFCENKNVDYDTVKCLSVLDSRIGPSHTSVPGPDGKKGFGGTCFPKDMASLLHQIQTDNEHESYIVEAAVARNKQVDRPEKDWAQDRGRAVV